MIHTPKRKMKMRIWKIVEMTVKVKEEEEQERKWEAVKVVVGQGSLGRLSMKR
jgi:hypothetical protein